jgi:AsmA protein
LNGALDFNVTNGAFEGTDLWYEIRRARALLHGEMPPNPTGAARTPFTSCKGTGVIRDGVLSNNDLDIAMQYLKVSGQGAVDIVKSTLDYRLNVQVLRVTDDSSAGDLVDAQIPVKVTGAFSSPSVRPDIEGMAKARLNQEIEKQKDKLRERLQDKLKDILGGRG